MLVSLGFRRRQKKGVIAGAITPEGPPSIFSILESHRHQPGLQLQPPPNPTPTKPGE